MTTSHDGPEHDPVPLLDLSRGHTPLRDEFLSAMAKVLDSGRFLHGPEVGELERQVASYCDSKHAISCASGSDALLLSLLALGIGAGDEVIVPSFTFFATASAAWRLGAKPVFVEIHPNTFNLCPESVERAITPDTRAIVPVHLFGQCADMTSIMQIAKERNLFVIEDAAQSIGATHAGKAAGSMGHIGCLSFYPTKNIGGIGDGGMLTTNDDHLAERLRLLAAHGMNPRYYHKFVGINSRLDSIQAAILLVKLKHLNAWTKARQLNAAKYRDLLAPLAATGAIEIPSMPTMDQHVWNQFTVRVKYGMRNRLREELKDRGIGTEVYYPVPLHLQECFSFLGWERGVLPVTELACEEVLSLPIFPELRIEEIERVASQLHAILAEPGRMAA